MTDKRGFTRFDNERERDVIGFHVAKKSEVTFTTELDFRVAQVQFMAAKTQTGNLQFSKSSSNETLKEAGNVIYCKITASGLHTLTFTSDFVEARNDFTGIAGTYDIWFTLLPDGKVMYSIIERP